MQQNLNFTVKYLLNVYLNATTTLPDKGEESFLPPVGGDIAAAEPIMSPVCSITCNRSIHNGLNVSSLGQALQLNSHAKKLI